MKGGSIRMSERFILRGTAYNIKKEDVAEAMKDVQPKASKKYYIRINNQEYPIKQALSTVVGIPSASFTSQDAYRILDKLGFKVEQWY